MKRFSAVKIPLNPHDYWILFLQAFHCNCNEDSTLTMIVETATGVDFDNAMARLASLPRQAEWEEFVGRYQKCASGSSSGEKWQRMSQIFELPE